MMNVHEKLLPSGRQNIADIKLTTFKVWNGKVNSVCKLTSSGTPSYSCLGGGTGRRFDVRGFWGGIGPCTIGFDTSDELIHRK